MKNRTRVISSGHSDRSQPGVRIPTLHVPRLFRRLWWITIGRYCRVLRGGGVSYERGTPVVCCRIKHGWTRMQTYLRRRSPFRPPFYLIPVAALSLFLFIMSLFRRLNPVLSCVAILFHTR